MGNTHTCSADIHILLVIDGILRFNKKPKGLDLLLRNLTSQIEPWLRIHIWPAHRDTYPRPWIAPSHLKKQRVHPPIFHFRFTPDMPVWENRTLERHITQIDQMWLIGQSFEEPVLTREENAFIRRFMATGKGVFASGDHEDMGLSMCGNIARVRHMRAWRDAFTQQEHGAPYTVHDSIRPQERHYPYTTKEHLEHQGLGKKLFPKTYHHAQCPAPHLPDRHPVDPANAFFSPLQMRPHPLLSSRHPQDDYLTTLPDHRHEGRVKTFDEIPPGEMEDWPIPPRSDTALFWDLIASAANRDVRYLAQQNPARPDARPSQFGVIGAYDGFFTECCGRIVVDATFHHHLNENLLGHTFTSHKRKRIRDTFRHPTDNAYLIHAFTYQRNTALWLCPWEKQQQLSALAVWYIVGQTPLRETLDQEMPPWEAGRLVLCALSTLVGTLWARHLWTYFFEHSRLTDMCAHFQRTPEKTLALLDAYILGTVAQRLRYLRGALKGVEKPEHRLRNEAVGAARKGLMLFAEHLKQYADDHRCLVDALCREPASETHVSTPGPGRATA